MKIAPKLTDLFAKIGKKQVWPTFMAVTKYYVFVCICVYKCRIEDLTTLFQGNIQEYYVHR